jgi:hypothetical protein
MSGKELETSLGDGTSLEFGQLDYCEGIESSSLPISIRNTTEHSFELLLKTHLYNADADFPVQLLIKKDTPVRVKANSSQRNVLKSSMSKTSLDKLIDNPVSVNYTQNTSKYDDQCCIIEPQSSVTLQAMLVVQPETNSTYIHSRFYHIRGLFQMLYRQTNSNQTFTEPVKPLATHQSQDPTLDEVGLCFDGDLDGSCRGLEDVDSSYHVLIVAATATLCTSLMHLDTENINFNDCVKGQSNIKEIMIWNRSESILRFHLGRMQEGDSKHSSSTVDIKVFDGETDKEIPFQQLIRVPSFAPKILFVKVTPKVIFLIFFSSKLTNSNFVGNYSH